MNYPLARQRERIIELERMLSNLIDRNNALEDALKTVSNHVERLEIRIDFLEDEQDET